MTQTPDNPRNSTRLDRIEAIQENTVGQVDTLTRRLDNLTDRVIRFEEQTQINISELVRGQALMTQLFRQLTEGQAEIAQTQAQLVSRQGLMEETIRRLEEGQEQMREIQTSLAAGQERQDRILDYLLRRVNGENT